MLRFGLIGYPLSHSMSPAIHNKAMDALGLRGKYELYEIQPDNLARSKLVELIGAMKSGIIQGLNVTIPYKNIIPALVDGTTSIAKDVGAVNTLYLDGERVIADNTDAPAFEKEIKNIKISAEGHAIILGAGGAAYAVAYTLLSAGWNLIIAARRYSQAQDLQNWFESHDNRYNIHSIILSPEGLKSSHVRAELIVNTTPVGMFPNNQNCPWPEQLVFPQRAFVYDLIYNPAETMLLKKAQAANLPTSGGAGMLVEQAALAFERWTGIEAPRSIMTETLSDLLAKKV